MATQEILDTGEEEEDMANADVPEMVDEDAGMGSLDTCVTLRGKSMMPVIGISMRMRHMSVLRRCIEAMLHGARHFELPIDDTAVWKALNKGLKQSLRRARKTRKAHWDLNQNFFISTTINASNEGGATVKDLVSSFLPLKMNMKAIDILYLENPVGLRGTDTRMIFKTRKNGTQSSRKLVKEMFDRKPDTGMLKLSTKIEQNLWLLWKRLERERQRKSLHPGKVKLLGLRNFSSAQIEALVRVAKHQPDVVQAEINAYNMQSELRSVCKLYNIQVIAIHPFGNPNNKGREGSAVLCHHPTVRKVATELRVHPKIVLLRFLLQLGIPFIYDICEYKPSTLFKEMWSTRLNRKHMKMLAALDGTNDQVTKRKINKWLQEDPLWPFYIPPQKRMRNSKLD